MTVVNVLLTRPQNSGVNLPVKGWLEWTATAVRNLSPELVLPVPFQTMLADTNVAVDAAATGPEWCWRIDYRVTGYKNITEYVAVPASGPVYFADLIRVDPSTLLPSAEPDAAWWAFADGLVVSGTQAAQAATDAIAAKDVSLTAKADTLAARDIVLAVPVTNDGITAGNIQTPGTATAAALNAAIGSQVLTADPERRSKLRRFWAALATGVCSVYIPGDSWTEGTRGADLPYLRYVDHLQNAIRSAAPNPVGGQYIPSWTTYPTRQPANWVYTGVTENGTASVTGKKETSGMGYYNREIPVGATASLTFNGTGFRMHMDRRPDGATVEVRVDGVLVTTYNTFLATLSTSEYRDYTGYAPGTHTLLLTVIAGSGSVFSLQGAYVYNTDEAVGVRVYPAGRGGITAKKFLTDYPFAGQLSAIIPDLVIFGLGGINDWRTGVSAADFEAALRNGVSAIRTRPLMADSSLVFLKFPQAQSAGSPVNTWAEYRAKVDLVAADVGGVVVDLEPIFGPGELNDLSPLVNADKIHPDDPGHLAIATTIAQAILPDPVPRKAEQESVWLTANRFKTVSGAPVEGVVNTTYYGFRLATDVVSGVVSEPLKLPAHWTTAELDLYFMNYSTGAGDIRWRVRVKKLPLGGSISVANNEDKTTAAKAQFVQDRIFKYHTTTITLAQDTDLYLEVTRQGADALDTLPNDAVFIGVKLRRTT